MTTTDNAKMLAGYKVLVVEDEMLVAVDYCQHLTEAGAEVVGPFATVEEATKSLDTLQPTVAVLDYALDDQTSDPLQIALKRRNIPCVVITGYPRVLVRRDDQQDVQSKPISPQRLCEVVLEACRGAA
jgi:DNA-binding NtrC family response regulator